MKLPNEVPSQAEFGLLRAYLAQQGCPQSWIKDHTDPTDTRSETVQKLREAMRVFTKGGL